MLGYRLDRNHRKIPIVSEEPLGHPELAGSKFVLWRPD